MRKLLSLISAALLCLSLTAPVQASTFVPSISYKDGPEIEEATTGKETVTGCLVVTSITEARDKSTDIYQEDRDLLLDVYRDLSDGTMKLPLENDKYVIRELVDVSWRKSECVEPEHDHKPWLKQEDTTIRVKFDLGVDKTVDLIVMTYIDGEWTQVVDLTNNGDGTVTVEFEDICPVVFCVKTDTQGGSPETGDIMSRSLLLWIALMAASFCAIVVLLVLHRKKSHR